MSDVVIFQRPKKSRKNLTNLFKSDIIIIAEIVTSIEEETIITEENEV